jgi:hypothetical protein
LGLIDERSGVLTLAQRDVDPRCPLARAIPQFLGSALRSGPQRHRVAATTFDPAAVPRPALSRQLSTSREGARQICSDGILPLRRRFGSFAGSASGGGGCLLFAGSELVIGASGNSIV